MHWGLFYAIGLWILGYDPWLKAVQYGEQR